VARARSWEEPHYISGGFLTDYKEVNEDNSIRMPWDVKGQGHMLCRSAVRTVRISRPHGLHTLHPGRSSFSLLHVDHLAPAEQILQFRSLLVSPIFCPMTRRSDRKIIWGPVPPQICPRHQSPNSEISRRNGRSLGGSSWAFLGYFSKNHPSVERVS
jgi:hypothetical protein